MPSLAQQDLSMLFRGNVSVENVEQARKTSLPAVSAVPMATVDIVVAVVSPIAVVMTVIVIVASRVEVMAAVMRCRIIACALQHV